MNWPVILFGGYHQGGLSLYRSECLAVLKELDINSFDSLVTDPPAGIAFMGKSWDKDKGGRHGWVAWKTEVMKECYRVLKPGAHALVWAIPRTSHWTATALEDAGFEIRDVVTHLFGTGFPKSLDVSKAIDKAVGVDRPVIGKIAAPASTKRIQTMSRPEHSGSGWKEAPDLTGPSTDDAKRWQGFGTALKPASEHWILCRKPISEKTVAANVLKWGTGAINVDGCRIGTEIIAQQQRDFKNAHGNKWGAGTKQPILGITNYTTGRFPANLVLSHNDDCDTECTEECAVKALDGQSGLLKSAGEYTKSKGQVVADGNSLFGLGNNLRNNAYANQIGGASRFFYCAKASKADRGDGNIHPTVKSTKLMQYLCRLVTPPGGIILDPFMGSGSTGIAALAEGFGFVGVEQEKAYYLIARQRLKKAQS